MMVFSNVGASGFEVILCIYSLSRRIPSMNASSKSATVMRSKGTVSCGVPYGAKNGLVRPVLFVLLVLLSVFMSCIVFLYC